MRLSPDEKSREVRLRHLANSRGLRLQRSRVRLPQHPTYGTYRLIGISGALVAGDRVTGYGLALDDVERLLGRDTAGHLVLPAAAGQRDTAVRSCDDCRAAAPARCRAHSCDCHG